MMTFLSLCLVLLSCCYAIPSQFIRAQPRGEIPDVDIPVKLAAPYAPIFAPIDDDGPAVGKNRISYNMGGVVFTEDVHVYLVYYGHWTDTQKALTETFVTGIGETDWYKTNQLYYFQQNSSSEKVHANGRVLLSRTVTDSYSRGTNLSGNDLPLILEDLIKSQNLPEDPHGLYFVLNSGDVQEQSRYGKYQWCDAYCGYHGSWDLPSGTRIRYAQTGLPPLDTCFNACSPRHHRYRSPNNDTSLDSMVSIIAHELVEMVTDPDFDDRTDGTDKRNQHQSERYPGWLDGYGQENADKCAFQFGNVTRVESERYWYNLVFSGKQWLIQQNWHPELQLCVNAP